MIVQLRSLFLAGTITCTFSFH